ncbi:hypothetical protein TRVL_08020 [Trypanosoma vivax]|uniref:Uncharacterized protein n=1 Tax=Trypanosoma vivax (strain Y486) TaxID=1055687 RepID=G0U0M6_TRYVY|nr:hypothetical protein TRVL_08020 [Trypanosoma vivax]CCC49625.1 conserved hypothetical protein [Trypanosoma vivax Y486]
MTLEATHFVLSNLLVKTSLPLFFPCPCSLCSHLREQLGLGYHLDDIDILRKKSLVMFVCLPIPPISILTLFHCLSPSQKTTHLPLTIPMHFGHKDIEEMSKADVQPTEKEFCRLASHSEQPAAVASGTAIANNKDSNSETTQNATRNSVSPCPVPIRINDSITMRELAEEYCVTSVIECDAAGRAKPRVVALDSPHDVLHSGKYYIARRDVKRLGATPRVAFSSKIVVSEFDSARAVAHANEMNENKITAVEGSSDKDGAGPANAVRVPAAPRKRGASEVGTVSDSDNDIEDLLNEASECVFVPFVGDLYNDGCEKLVQLSDVKKLCENVDLNEAEFRARHARAQAILDGARNLLARFAASNDGSGCGSSSACQ